MVNTKLVSQKKQQDGANTGKGSITRRQAIALGTVAVAVPLSAYSLLKRRERDTYPLFSRVEMSLPPLTQIKIAPPVWDTPDARAKPPKVDPSLTEAFKSTVIRPISLTAASYDGETYSLRLTFSFKETAAAGHLARIVCKVISNDGEVLQKKSGLFGDPSLKEPSLLSTKPMHFAKSSDITLELPVKTYRETRHVCFEIEEFVESSKRKRGHH